MGELLYLYAVLSADSPAVDELAAGSLPGIGGGRVRAVVEGPVAAAVGAVSAAEFDEGPLNERLRDMERLGPRAAAHQAVNGRLFELGEALVPLSFGTVYRDEARLRGALRARAAEFEVRLESVHGRGEWVVALTREQDRAVAALEEASEPLRRLREEIASAPPGRAYLMRRQVDELRRVELARLDAGAVEAALAELGTVAERVHREPLVEAAGGPIARASLLVPRARAGALMEAVARLNEEWERRGYSLRATGPWPPYRFGGLPLDG